MTLAATKDTPNLSTVADAVKTELRTLISRWSRSNPERIITAIPLDSLRTLQGFDDSARMVVLSQLEDYVGAALPTNDAIQPADKPQEHPIEWPYELHPMLVSGFMQVLLISDDLKKYPIRRLADEVAYQAQNYAQKFVVDEVFRFTLQNCVVERVEKMTQANKANFRATLNRRLVAVGLWSENGTVYSTLEIRRNR